MEQVPAWHVRHVCVLSISTLRAVFVNQCSLPPGQLVVTGEIRLATPLHLYRIPCLIRAIFASGIALVSGIHGRVRVPRRTSTPIVLDTLCWLRCLSSILGQSPDGGLMRFRRPNRRRPHRLAA